METLELKAILEYSRKYNIWNGPLKGTTASDTDRCEYCGKKLGKNPLYVHVTYMGTCVPNTVTKKDLAEYGEDSQGCWGIGSECAKNLFGSDLEKYTIKSK